jgi:hypothetical protein
MWIVMTTQQKIFRNPWPMRAHPATRKSAGTIDLNWVMLIIAYTLIIHDEWSRILQLIFGSFESLQLSAVRIGRFINWATPKANLL